MGYTKYVRAWIDGWRLLKLYTAEYNDCENDPSLSPSNVYQYQGCPGTWIAYTLLSSPPPPEGPGPKEFFFFFFVYV